MVVLMKQALIRLKNGTEVWSEVNTYYPARNVTTQITLHGESSEAALRSGLYDIKVEWNELVGIQTTAESGLDGGHL